LLEQELLNASKEGSRARVLDYLQNLWETTYRHIVPPHPTRPQQAQVLLYCLLELDTTDILPCRRTRRARSRRRPSLMLDVYCLLELDT
jgi:hypothetical protein